MASRSVDPILARIAAGLERGDLKPLSADDPLEAPEGYPGFDPIARALLARRYRKAMQRSASIFEAWSEPWHPAPSRGGPVLWRRDTLAADTGAEGRP